MQKRGMTNAVKIEATDNTYMHTETNTNTQKHKHPSTET